MKLKPLCIGDYAIISKYLAAEAHELSVYAFANMYIWKALYDIRWAVIGGSLCVFFRDAMGEFVYFAPLGGEIRAFVVDQAFELMDKTNKNKSVSRIENLEAHHVAKFEALGYTCTKKSDDYVCRTSSLANLSGDAFKSKRASVNYFLKHFHYQVIEYSSKYSKECLELYATWAIQRRKDNLDSVYRGMIDDSKRTLEVILKDYRRLRCSGILVLVDGVIKGFSFGYPLNRETFCVLFEITDLSVRGLAQFIFREFARSIQHYPFINIMDDSGLENLRNVKESYRPIRVIPAYIATRTHA